MNLRQALSQFVLGLAVVSISATSAEVLSLPVTGIRIAAVRPAIGLKLGAETMDEVVEWGVIRGIACERRSSRILCRDVKPRLIGDQVGVTPIELLTFTFNSRGRLDGVDILRGPVSPAEASLLVNSISHRLSRVLGKPSREDAFSTQYHFRNYVALVSQTSHRILGIRVHEEYLGED
jgi:hypothetical protein